MGGTGLGKPGIGKGLAGGAAVGSGLTWEGAIAFAAKYSPLVLLTLTGDSPRRPTPSSGMPAHSAQPGSSVTTFPKATSSKGFGVNYTPKAPNLGTGKTTFPAMPQQKFGVGPINATDLPANHVLTSNGLPVPLGRGSTADPKKYRFLPRNLREELAVQEAMGDAANGQTLPFPMTDRRWPLTDGWVKMQYTVDSGGREGPIIVHYVYNTKTGQITAF